MVSKLHLSLRHVKPLDTVIVTVPVANYGSTNFDLLMRLDSAFADVAGNTASLSVILDLSAIEISGSHFLACLDSLEKQLASTGRRLVVCGDRTGLIQLVNWSDRMSYQRDLVSALNQCALLPA